MAYGLSNGHVTDDMTWPPKVLWGSTVGYPRDSLASCLHRFRNESSRTRFAAEQVPDQAGAQYVTFATTVARNTSCSAERLMGMDAVTSHDDSR